MSSDLKDLVAFVNSFSEFGNYTSLNKEGAGGAGAGGEGSGGEAKIDGGGEAGKAGEVGEEETVLKFQCEGRHTLTEFTIPEEQYFCDGCRENSEDEGWLKMKGGRVCDYDLCIECSLRRRPAGDVDEEDEDEDEDEDGGKNWLPLESNPVLMSNYTQQLGLDEA